MFPEGIERDYWYVLTGLIRNSKSTNLESIIKKNQVKVRFYYGNCTKKPSKNINCNE